MRQYQAIFVSHDWPEASLTAETVIDPQENEYQATGLVDHRGVPLMRKRETVAFGFQGRGNR